MIALLLATLGLFATPPPLIEGIPYVEQPRSPQCVAAAAVMVGRFHGRPMALKAFARTLPVHADGIAWLDLVEALPAHGLNGLLVQADPGDLKALLDSGLPGIVAVHDGAGRHAWVVRGYDASGWHILDPAAPGLRRVDRATFAERWTGGLVIVHPAGAALPPEPPWTQWTAESARARAEGWLKRARQRPALDALALLDYALAADPGHVAVHLQRAAVLGELKRGEEACAAVERARQAARRPAEATITAQVARTLGCTAAARAPGDDGAPVRPVGQGEAAAPSAPTPGGP